MPALPLDLRTFAANSTKLVSVRSPAIKLRPENAAGTYNPASDFVKEYGTFVKVGGTGVKSLWGLGVVAQLNDGTIEFQLSKDDGTSWLYWGGASWDAAGAEDWSDIADVRKNIAAFPLGTGADRSVRLRMRLQPDTTKRKTPIVYDLWLKVEYEYDPIVDLYRTVHAALSAVEHRLRCRESADGTANVTLSDFDFTVVPASGIEVYNLTDDPGRGADLFQAYDAGTKVVTMTGAQDVDDVLEIRFKATAPVHLVTDGFTHDAELPAILLQTNVSEDRQHPQDIQYEINAETKIARRRPGPRYLQFSVLVTCADNDQERAIEMAGAVRRHLEQVACFTSLASGLPIVVGDVEPYTPSVSVNDGVHSPRVRFSAWAVEHDEAYVQSVLASDIAVHVHGEEIANVRKLLDPTVTWHDEVLNIT